MSMPLVLSSAVVNALPGTVRNWRGLSIEWEGRDGSEWNLTDPQGGVVLYRGGLEGLHFPRITKNSSTSRAIPGKRPRGWRAESRDVFWPIYLGGDGSDAWLDRHSAFFDTIHPSEPGTWKVSAGRETRTLQLTGVFEDLHAYERDPLMRGWALYEIALEAAQPFWQGARVRRGPWKAPETLPFFPGPPFRISSSSAFGSAEIPNTGDVDAWGVWWVAGPLTEIELGVGGAIIRPPFPVEDGQLLRIDTDPRNPTAQLGAIVLDDDGKLDTDRFVGEDVTRDLGLQDYAAVPPGASVNLHVEATGAGAVLFDLIPLHFRAF